MIDRSQSTDPIQVSPKRTLFLTVLAVLTLTGLLVLTQWFSHAKIPIISLHEVNLLDTAELPHPENEPPNTVDAPVPNFTPPPPKLELELALETPTLPMVAMIPSFDVQMEMADFALDTPPINVQALPDSKPPLKQVATKRTSLSRAQPRVQQRPPKAKPRPRPGPPPVVQPKPKPKPAPTKSTYNASELDRRPQLRNKKSLSSPFPSQLLKSGVTSGNAILTVEIDTTGRVRVLAIASISHPELKPMAMQVARKARFTKPTKNGTPVKARFRWPVTLRK